MKGTDLKAWVTYEYLCITEEWADGSFEISEFNQGDELNIIAIIPPSLAKEGNMYSKGCFVVKHPKGAVTAFDGSFISFINPNTKELN
ncbi:hypothetical protein OCA97_14740 [Bacillus cereus]|nr:hypothetical protein [Bacillus cereus]